MNDLDSYQSPFQRPLFSLPTISGGADFSTLLTIGFFLIFVVWAIYTIIAAYHWFRYMRHSWLAVPSMAVHIFISGLLIFYIASGV